MRNMRWSVAASSLAVFGAVGWVMGCSASSQEDLTDPALGHSKTSSSTGGGGSPSTTSSSSSTSSSAGTGGAAPGCDPMDPTFVSDMCGVFVAAAGKTGAMGTMTDPLPTLDEGIKAAVTAGKYVFACADTFNEQVTITTGLAIYGGRDDCMKGWTVKAGGATTINGPDDKIALTITTPGHVILENVDVIAPLGTIKSKSSIAVLISEADAELKNCNFTSKDAFKGDDGAMIPYDAALDGLMGSAGKPVCSIGSHPGGAAQVKTCGGVTSTGGKGGDGGAPQAISGGNGGDGTISSAATTSVHGNGQTAALMCTPGGPGAAGLPGSDGSGAKGVGSISASGYLGVNGGTGGTGTPGVGGGGGGGSKGTLVATTMACNITDPTDYYGASGGSGGSGGCGGKPGNFGGPGGSSIALAVVNAKSVSLDTVTLTPGRGGTGGAGGPGQLGGAQGAFGNAGDATNGGTLDGACLGGPGGKGGVGGPGGGGQGGHSLGLAIKGTAPKGMPTFPKMMDPQPGPGGLAGTGAKDPAVGKGVDGNSTTPKSYTLQFP